MSESVAYASGSYLRCKDASDVRIANWRCSLAWPLAAHWARHRVCSGSPSVRTQASTLRAGQSLRVPPLASATCRSRRRGQCLGQIRLSQSADHGVDVVSILGTAPARGRSHVVLPQSGPDVDRVGVDVSARRIARPTVSNVGQGVDRRVLTPHDHERSHAREYQFAHIVLDGGDGNVHVSGEINTSGKTGGKITVTGENIALASADLNASGTNGGGTVKIGGDYQGKGTTPHAKTVKVDTNSKINVSATDSGNGGTSIVWSDELTNFKGTILGTGGVNGGNGGLAEVSSKGTLGYDGFADLHATVGEAGTLLLDPHNLFLGNIGDFVWVDYDFVNVNATVATLNTGTNVIHTATNNLLHHFIFIDKL